MKYPDPGKFYIPAEMISTIQGDEEIELGTASEIFGVPLVAHVAARGGRFVRSGASISVEIPGTPINKWIQVSP